MRKMRRSSERGAGLFLSVIGMFVGGTVALVALLGQPEPVRFVDAQLAVPGRLPTPQRSSVVTAMVPLRRVPDARAEADDYPVSVSVPSARIQAPLVPTGESGPTGMAVTKDPAIANWFGPGTYPGDEGSAVIAGHSGYASGPAAFDALPNVRVGDLVHVALASGDALTFMVSETRRYPFSAEVPQVYGRSDGRYLNLITCTGSFDSGAGTHRERLVVFTRLVE